MFRVMVDAELWQNVPISLADLGGILGIIRMNIARSQLILADTTPTGAGMLEGQEQPDSVQTDTGADTACGAAAACDGDGDGGGEVAVYKSNMLSILSSFGGYGNPLSQFSAEDGSAEGGDSAGGGGGSSPAPEGKAKAPKAVGGTNMDFWDSLLQDGDVASSPKTVSKSKSKNTKFIITQSALNGLGKYCAQYMHVMYRVPSIAVDAYHGLIQLLEYYLLAVFHGFVPVDERNKLLSKPTKMTAPPPDQIRTYEALQSCMDRVSGTVVQIVSKRAPPSAANTATSSSAAGAATGADGENGSADREGEGAAPAPQINIVTRKLSSLLHVPPCVEQLAHGDYDENSCTMFAVNERVVAAESCYFVSEMVSELRPKIMRLLPESYQRLFSNFVSEYNLVIGQLTAFIYRSMCADMLNHVEITKQILEVNWDSKNMQGDTHVWVENLVTHCERAWHFLNMDDGNLEAKTLVKEQVWMEICTSAFEIVLDAFCKVRKCSKEGRAAMGMDLSALHSGLDSIHANRTPKGKAHVEALCVKLSYLGDEEAMRWIEENYQAYSYRNVLGLVTVKMSSLMNPKKLKDAVATLDNLYEIHDGKDDNILLGALLSHSSSSSMMPSFGSKTPSLPSLTVTAEKDGGSSSSSASASAASGGAAGGTVSPVGGANGPSPSSAATSASAGTATASSSSEGSSGSSISNMFGNRMRAARASIVGGISNLRGDES